MRALHFRKGTREERITIIAFLIVFAFTAFLHVYPIFWSLINALKTGEEYFASNTAMPSEWRFGNFLRVFNEFIVRDYNYMDMLWNSLWMLFVRVFVNVAASAMLAYVLARFRFPGSSFLYLLVIIANTIPIIGSGAAGFKLMIDLDMINNPFTIWFSWANGFDFAFIIFYGTFKGISRAYSEAAKIDGANNMVIFFNVVLPQAIPSILAIAITQAIGVWQDYSTPMIYMRDYPTLAYGLYLFDTESNYIQDSKPIYFAAAIISCIPVIILYGSNMQLIMNNVTAGGLKG